MRVNYLLIIMNRNAQTFFLPVVQVAQCLPLVLNLQDLPLCPVATEDSIQIKKRIYLKKDKMLTMMIKL